MSSVYQINKGVNQPVVFKGLKAQWIWWLGGGIAVLLLMFAVLYIMGVNLVVCVGLIVVLGVLLFTVVYRFSRKYGEFGLMKEMASKSVPSGLMGCSRKNVAKNLCDENCKRGITHLVGRK